MRQQNGQVQNNRKRDAARPGESINEESTNEEPLDNNESIVKVSLEDIYALKQDFDREVAQEELIDTQHSDGSTYNPQQAQEQGLVYMPPADPPVLPDEDFQGAEIAAGFAPSMEDVDPSAEVLPIRVENNDLDVQEDIYTVLQTNSETSKLDNPQGALKEALEAVERQVRERRERLRTRYKQPGNRHVESAGGDQ